MDHEDNTESLDVAELRLRAKNFPIVETAVRIILTCSLFHDSLPLYKVNVHTLNNGSTSILVNWLIYLNNEYGLFSLIKYLSLIYYL